MRAKTLISIITLALIAQLRAAAVSDASASVTRQFFSEVIRRHPQDLLTSGDLKPFAPFLSRTLLQEIETAKACAADWKSFNQEAPEQSSFDVFSGDGYESGPQTSSIEKTSTGTNGITRVYVRLAMGQPKERGYSWRVAAVVKREDNRFVIDDIIYINDSTWDDPTAKPPDKRLSQYLSAGCKGAHWYGYSLPHDPDALTQSLYREVLERTPGGVPSGENWKVFAVYISRSLLHKIFLFNACGADWDRQYGKADPPVKPPFGIYESGIFSGGDEKTGPRAFQLENTQLQPDGSIRANVKLSWWESARNPPDPYRTTVDKPYIWHVAPVLIYESDRVVVDDVIYLKEREGDQDYRLSQELSAGCDGPHYVGWKEDGITNVSQQALTLAPLIHSSPRMTLWLPILALAYLLGSIPFGYLVVRLFKHEDVRATGSGNIGATNVVRAGGKGLGILTLLLDTLKGYAAVVIAMHFAPTVNGLISNLAIAAAVTAVLGHVFPIWLRFHGGKGIATALGVFLALVPLIALLSLGVFIVIVALTRYVSLASILAAVSIPVLAIWLAPHRTTELMLGLTIICLIGIAKHHANIGRLLNGTESRFGKSKVSTDRPTA